MSFEEFVEVAKELILEYLPEEYHYADIRLIEIAKTNGNYLGMNVRKDEAKIAPTINLNGFYEYYERGESVENILRKMAECICLEAPNMDANILTDYKQARDRLFIRVCSTEWNKERLENVPHKEVADMAITYHLLLSEDDSRGATALITNKMLEYYGVTAEQLHEDALENSQKIMPPLVRDLEELLAEETPDEEVFLHVPMTVVTNEKRSNGAAALFYPGMMERLAETMEGNYYILPSSTHEQLLLPDIQELEWRELKDMVEDINATQVAPTDRLANQVYHYDSQDKVFETAEAFENRIAQRGRESIKTESGHGSVLQKLGEKKQEAQEFTSSKPFIGKQVEQEI